MQDKTLVLFDIDGTLITPLRPAFAISRFSYAIKKVMGVDVEVNTTMWKRFNGWSDRGIFWTLLKEQTKTTKQDMLAHIDEISDAFVEYLESLAVGQKVYAEIPAARQLFDKVKTGDHLILGTLTGNLEKSAKWKLKHTGVPVDSFVFGVYGHEADTRDELARLVIPRANAMFHMSLKPHDIIVIGDTVHDIRCARVIGARVVAVSTGWNIAKEDLANEKPDLLVDSLLDERVLTLLGLGQ